MSKLSDLSALASSIEDEKARVKPSVERVKQNRARASEEENPRSISSPQKKVRKVKRVGRPSNRQPDVDYAKLSVMIPVPTILKLKRAMALPENYKRQQQDLVAEAIEAYFKV